MSPLCLARWLVRNLRSVMLGQEWIPVAGHEYQLQEPVPGQPDCVMVLKCIACGHTSVGWRDCDKCGAP